MQHGEVCPSKTTLAAWWRWSINDLSWCLVHRHLCSHDWISSCSAANLSAGRWADCCSEFTCNLIPKTVKQVYGQIHLPGRRGRPRDQHTDRQVSRLLAQCCELADPIYNDHLFNHICYGDKKYKEPCVALKGGLSQWKIGPTTSSLRGNDPWDELPHCDRATRHQT